MSIAYIDACLAVNPITVGNFAFLLNCTLVGQTSDSKTVPTYRLIYWWDGRAGCSGCLSGPLGFTFWISFALVFSFIYCLVIIQGSHKLWNIKFSLTFPWPIFKIPWPKTSLFAKHNWPAMIMINRYWLHYPSHQLTLIKVCFTFMVALWLSNFYFLIFLNEYINECSKNGKYQL